MKLTESCVDVCDICGFTTNKHLIHASDGNCYCTRHYLMHLLREDIEEAELQLEEQKFHK